MRSAVDLASVGGLDGLSIGGLASEVSMSKSGIAGLFGSKEDLQLAVIAAAADIFQERVIVPAMKTPAGLERLRALVDAWIEYSESRVFAGGCFFAAAAAEYRARPGTVRDAVAVQMRRWNAFMAEAVSRAVATGELPGDTDPLQLAFEITAMFDAANDASLLARQRRALRASPHGDRQPARTALTDFRRPIARADDRQAETVTDTAASAIVSLERLRASLADPGLALPLDGAAEHREAAAAAVRQIDDYIRPRLADLDAPLLAVVGGSTGSGKSTIVNALIGTPITRVGVIRPTTRQPILVHAPGDAGWFASARILPGLARVRGTLSAPGTPASSAGMLPPCHASTS